LTISWPALLFNALKDIGVAKTITDKQTKQVSMKGISITDVLWAFNGDSKIHKGLEGLQDFPRHSGTIAVLRTKPDAKILRGDHAYALAELKGDE
jgi:hypothetical protein